MLTCQSTCLDEQADKLDDHDVRLPEPSSMSHKLKGKNGNEWNETCYQKTGKVLNFAHT